jgi:hypothetical protein
MILTVKLSDFLRKCCSFLRDCDRGRTEESSRVNLVDSPEDRGDLVAILGTRWSGAAEGRDDFLILMKM